MALGSPRSPTHLTDETMMSVLKKSTLTRDLEPDHDEVLKEPLKGSTQLPVDLVQTSG